MLKKLILTFFILIFSSFGQALVFADSIPVEDIFSDIDVNYKYINELQTLYDKGMITPDSEGRFNPKALLNRDEFVGILMEVTCTDCIQPNTALNLINSYENSQVFYDINKINKYFYCVAEANNKGFVSGYQIGTTCDDGTVRVTEKPFCPANTIILEEAIAVILRASGILTNEEADAIRQDIYNGNISEKIADDVSPKNLDGSVYSFYPDLRKALEYEVQDIDSNGNVATYTLLEKVDGKLRPKKAVSKEDFLRIAFVALKANSCEIKKENNLALKMIIYDKSCDENKTNCKYADLSNISNIYDFTQDVYTTCEAGITEPEGYIWRFYNNDTGNEIKKYGKYINNYDFLLDGKWTVFLRVIDKCGNTAEVFNTININSTNIELKVSLKADSIYGSGPLLVNFEGIVFGGVGPYTYYWNFGEGNNGLGKNITNIFKEEGIYEIILYVTDSSGKIGNASVLIQVIGKNKCDIDSDYDGVSNCDDLCPLIKGDIKNKGCPIFEKECTNNSDCNEGYYCTDDTYICLPKKVSNSCEYSGGDIVFGNVICNTCPCNNFLDFISTLRKCDYIFPAITSPDSKNIYSKGELFQIK